MLLQNVLTGNRRLPAIFDLLEAGSGLALALFLWMHMLFVASIYVGPHAFDTIAHSLDDYYLSYVGIPPLLAVFFLHFLLAARKIPTTWREQRVFWSRAEALGHKDTWTWLVQVVTGMALLLLASIHFWVVLSTWPVEASLSSYRVGKNSYLAFYLVLLVLGEFHAGLGLYRLSVKWGWPRRHTAELLFEFLGAVVIAAGLGALWFFRHPGGRLF